MKISHALTASLIGLSSLLSTSLTAQETTTLNEITEQKRAEALRKSEVKRELANPTSTAQIQIATKSENVKKQSAAPKAKMTEADFISIQKRIDKQKADLALAKSNNSLDAETLEEKKLEIEKAEKALKMEKKKATAPVSKSN